MKTFANPPDLVSIHARLATLKSSDAALWGVMNVAQMVCHLDDSFHVALGNIKSTPIKVTSIPMPIVKWIAFRSGLPWRKNVPTLPEVKHDGGGTRPTEFGVDLDRLRRSIDQFAGNTAWAPHPFFGDMTTAEWMRWGYIHCDHHLRQFGR
jgi:Protein of unknown function (DUF1569)